MEIPISPSLKCFGIDTKTVLDFQETRRLEETDEVRISMVYEYVGESIASTILSRIKDLPECVINIEAVPKDYKTFLDTLFNSYKTVAGALETISMDRSRARLTQEMQAKVDQYLNDGSY